MSGAALKVLSRLQFLSRVVFPDPRKPQTQTIGIFVIDMSLALKVAIKKLFGCHILLGKELLLGKHIVPFSTTVIVSKLHLTVTNCHLFASSE